MSSPTILALIQALPPTLAASAALIMAVRNHKATKDIHLAINSRFDQWMAATKIASFAEGAKAEADKQAK